MSEEYLPAPRLLPCPFCGSQPKREAMDRLIVIACEPCGYRRGFPGLLQTAESPVHVAGREFYHRDAGRHANEAWNRRAPAADIEGRS